MGCMYLFELVFLFFVFCFSIYTQVHLFLMPYILATQTAHGSTNFHTPTTARLRLCRILLSFHKLLFSGQSKPQILGPTLQNIINQALPEAPTTYIPCLESLSHRTKHFYIFS